MQLKKRNQRLMQVQTETIPDSDRANGRCREPWSTEPFSSMGQSFWIKRAVGSDGGLGGISFLVCFLLSLVDSTCFVSNSELPNTTGH